MNKSIFRYTFGLFLFVLAFYILSKGQYFSLLSQVTLGDIAVSLLLSFMLASVGGFAMKFLIFHQYQTKISWIDMVTLPLMMNLWGFIIPLRGGMLYSIFFLKSKYKLKIVQGASMTVYMYKVSFFLMGCITLIYLILNDNLVSWGSLFCLGLICNAFVIKFLNYLYQKFSFFQVGWFKKIQHLVDVIINGARVPRGDFKIPLVVMMLLLTRFFLRALRYQWGVYVFGLDIPFFPLLLLSLSVEFSNIMFRFSPGNLGLNELISGGVVNVLGGSTEEGLLIALFSRFSNLLLIFTLGAWAVIQNMKHFDTFSLKSLWLKVKSA